VIRTIFFDAAGTLLEPAERVGETYARFARRSGVIVDPSALDRGFRAAFSSAPPLAFPPGAADRHARERAWWRRVVFEAFTSTAPATPSLPFDQVFAAVFEHFARPDAWRVFADVQPTLKQLHTRGLRLAVVSNFDTRLHGLLEGLGLAGSFHSVVLSSECGSAKPDARIFAAALRATGATPQATLHVGDSEELDVRGAKSAGVAALRIDRGATSGAATIGTLLELVERLN
jgi:putative hydrolase of the HAD superfamily